MRDLFGKVSKCIIASVIALIVTFVIIYGIYALFISDYAYRGLIIFWLIIIFVLFLVLSIARYMYLVKKERSSEKTNCDGKCLEKNVIMWCIVIALTIITFLLSCVATEIISLTGWNDKPCAGTVTRQDKESYNAKVKGYIGKNKSGHEVKQMIEAIISQNDTNVAESGKFISIKLAEGEEIPNLKNSNGEEDLTGKALAEACDKANIYSEERGNNTQENVDVAKKEMRTLYKAISSGKTYSILDSDGDKSGITDGIIHTVYIKENK